MDQSVHGCGGLSRMSVEWYWREGGDGFDYLTEGEWYIRGVGFGPGKGLRLSDDEKQNVALFWIEQLMLSRGTTLRRFPEMPYPDSRYINQFGNRLIYDETHYNPDELQSEYERLERGKGKNVIKEKKKNTNKSSCISQEDEDAFHVNFFSLEDWSDDEDSDKQYQNLKLLGASLGITLDRKQHRSGKHFLATFYWKEMEIISSPKS
ncbi:hypothetical protein CTI12_AA534910 [Artemisia annua]|uniref:Uncharacterized protein n=1 Tax=Artemisia annua TaxID=35608 RepID=A0A2U1L322_ARTAN|nr:hypothetical protein CTI12_AA534910 [Artemisia annua]